MLKSDQINFKCDEIYKPKGLRSSMNSKHKKYQKKHIDAV